MNQIISPAPVRRSFAVKAAPARAFETFTTRMGAWWPVTHSINRATAMTGIVIEPRMGGRWYERGADGSECQWGRVLVWEPPERLVLAWQLDANFRFNPDLVTEIEVRFLADGIATRVEFEHRNLDRYGQDAAKVRGQIDAEGGWTKILELFAASLAA
jgi:uncharacterized protein YndB with AHSA1/START domain